MYAYLPLFLPSNHKSHEMMEVGYSDIYLCTVALTFKPLLPYATCDLFYSDKD